MAHHNAAVVVRQHPRRYKRVTGRLQKVYQVDPAQCVHIEQALHVHRLGYRLLALQAPQRCFLVLAVFFAWQQPGKSAALAHRAFCAGENDLAAVFLGDGWQGDGVVLGHSKRPHCSAIAAAIPGNVLLRSFALSGLGGK